MSNFHTIEPEVAGSLGPNTVIDSGEHPPVVSKLHYQFDGWLGDQIVESFPAYLVTEELARRLHDSKLTGFEIDDAEVSTSDEFHELHPNKQLPKFVWFKIAGTPGRDDFGLDKDGRLVVSDRALALINSTSPRGLDISSYGG